MKDLVIQGPKLSPEALDTFKVVCLPERITLYKRAARCVAVRDDAETRKAVQGLSDFWKLDNAFVDPRLRLSDFRLLALDMDSTLVNIETLDEVAAYAGKGEQIAAITDAAMRGEVDYKESLRRRVSLLAGVEATLLARVHDEKLGAQRRRTTACIRMPQCGIEDAARDRRLHILHRAHESETEHRLHTLERA